MASSYTTTLGIELMVTGEKSGTWGDITNTNLNIVEQSQGYLSKSIAGGVQTTPLTITDGATTTSDARNLIIELTGTITGNQTVTIPDGIEKSYIVYNNTTGSFTVQFKTASGTGPTFSATDKGTKIVYSNGTDVVDTGLTAGITSVVEDTTPQLGGDLDVNGNEFVSTSNGDIVFTPNGTGKIKFNDAAYNPEATLTDGATISWDAQAEPVAKVTLAGNRTMAAPTNGATGQFVSLLVIQDGTGTRTLTWNAVYEFASDTPPTLTATGGLGDLFVFRYNGTKWLEVGRNLALTLS